MEEAARLVAQEAARLRKIEEERFLTEVLDRHASGEITDHQTQEKFLSACVSYLGVVARTFRLSRDERLARGFNSDHISERRLSEALYGPEYDNFNTPGELDKNSFSVRLGNFLGVEDYRGSTRYLASTTPPISTIPPVQPVTGGR